MGILYIVATPIGNLEDITFRAVRILMESDFILAEDTRSAKKLLEHFNIKKPLLSYWAHNHFHRLPEITQLLRSRRNLALISEAGTPAISDPGTLLVSEIARELKNQTKIVPIPGSSAVAAALSVAGFPAQQFLFAGFPPQKNKRQKFFKEALRFNSGPIVFYESPHRILKTLQDLIAILGKQAENRQAAVFRELTKQFETAYRGTLPEILAQLEKENIRGEFVIVLGPKSRHEFINTV